jgi:hypothetical protein
MFFSLPDLSSSDNFDSHGIAKPFFLYLFLPVDVLIILAVQYPLISQLDYNNNTVSYSFARERHHLLAISQSLPIVK